MNLVRALGSVGGLTLVSRVLALGRDTLQATFVGAGFASDAFLVAFRLPNMFRAFFAEGAFNAAFTPLFNKKVGADQDYPAAFDFAERALAVLFPILVVFTAAMLIAAEPVTLALSGGFDDPTPAQFAFAVTLSRITIPYLALMSLVSLLGGILTSLERFWVNAAAPVLLNVAMIVALVFFHGDNPYETARAQAVAVTAGGVLQLGWLVIACRGAGVRLRLRMPRIDNDLRELGRLVLPAALGAGATQINLLVSTALAGGLLDAGSISYIYYADRLNQLPLGMIGIGLGTILLPTLSRLLAARDDAAAMATQNRGIELALFLTLPATVAFLVVAEPIVRGLFQHGAFTTVDAARCAMALAAFSIGLPAYVLIKVLAPAFYARGDTRTPARFAMLAVAVNLIANLILIPTIAHVGPPLATALAAWVNIGLLAATLMNRGHFVIDARLRRRLPRLALAAVAMGAALWALVPLLDPWLTDTAAIRAAALVALVAGGGLVYALACLLTGAYGPADLKALRRGKAN
ncbi:murein biosynthesis integral membrane protein MurJ [Sphingomonas sp.]|uniref:murein biosynthesis integral membrane protein MurJ n=1 Tax=Sphingomonas sp. TaxID=28214 RepID=UPI002C5B72E0|nr:murein biosynthesis integral membrane protein MurJ [Sphingomonas sp.]HTG37323.1 murein biosynthesis integral membrane protein MurJ [Sphingomonas sp.]